MVHAACSGLDGRSFSIATPVSRVIARAKGREGVALPDRIFVIMDRSQPTRAARAASVTPVSERICESVFMRINVNVMNVNVKHVRACHFIDVRFSRCEK
jgi:hypothetical protein